MSDTGAEASGDGVAEMPGSSAGADVDGNDG